GSGAGFGGFGGLRVDAERLDAAEDDGGRGHRRPAEADEGAGRGLEEHPGQDQGRGRRRRGAGNAEAPGHLAADPRTVPRRFAGTYEDGGQARDLAEVARLRGGGEESQGPVRKAP